MRSPMEWWWQTEEILELSSRTPQHAEVGEMKFKQKFKAKVMKNYEIYLQYQGLGNNQKVNDWEWNRITKTEATKELKVLGYEELKIMKNYSRNHF